MASTRRRRQRSSGRSRPYYWLLILPFVWQVAFVPLVNDVSAAPLDIPFPMVWQMAGVLVASAVIGVVYLLDERAGVAAEEAAFIAATAATPEAAAEAMGTAEAGQPGANKPGGDRS
ncbi:DUF3311 domain-containing protein [Streptomyces sp. NBC_00878]|uniref:DUF3311 domain-containing protein n=1 Tax=Streptomyces sp. NBC_00878 TaxID=2975854 RepID=UPI00224E1BCD|nr:DUF3311 domain-containing protein [Streptomyces sp. NBC_00878]MCX4904638.1 DUF3311 domain-containing protein [Streptomyces sp. NBC_00878]